MRRSSRPSACWAASWGARLEDDANYAGLFAAAQVFINRHLASHRLSPALIARLARLFAAHLYRVFASRGEAVADYVRELRLRRARDLSSRDTEAETRIGDLAYRCGFDDPVHSLVPPAVRCHPKRPQGQRKPIRVLTS